MAAMISFKAPLLVEFPSHAMLSSTVWLLLTTLASLFPHIHPAAPQVWVQQPQETLQEWSPALHPHRSALVMLLAVSSLKHCHTPPSLFPTPLLQLLLMSPQENRQMENLKAEQSIPWLRIECWTHKSRSLPSGPALAPSLLSHSPLLSPLTPALYFFLLLAFHVWVCVHDIDVPETIPCPTHL